MLENAKQGKPRNIAVILLISLIVLRDLLVGTIYYFHPVPLLHISILELLIVGQLWASYQCKTVRATMDRLIIFYAIWAVLTRILLADFTEKISMEILTVCEMCVAFCAMRSTEQETGSRIFKLITAALSVFLTVCSVCGIIVVLSDVGNIQMLNISIQIDTEPASGGEGILRFLNFYPLHRNESAAWMMIGFWLLAYQWVSCKRKLWRIPVACAMLLMYISIALQRSRSVCVVTGLTVGLLAASGWLKLRWKKLPKYFLMVLTVLLCTFVVYKSFSAINNGLAVLSAVHKEGRATEEIVPATLGEVPQVEEEPDVSEIIEPTVEEEPVLADQRSFFKDLTTLTLRTRIWKCEGYALLHNPKLLLLGQREADVTLNMIRYGGLDVPAGHTHNGLLQVLAMYGVPGVILIGLFLALLLKRMLYVYFEPSLEPVKLLVLPIAGLLVYSIMEPMFTARLGLATACFMLIAGKLCREDTVSH